jgi:hypothetical protein
VVGVAPSVSPSSGSPRNFAVEFIALLGEVEAEVGVGAVVVDDGGPVAGEVGLASVDCANTEVQMRRKAGMSLRCMWSPEWRQIFAQIHVRLISRAMKHTKGRG